MAPTPDHAAAITKIAPTNISVFFIRPPLSPTHECPPSFSDEHSAARDLSRDQVTARSRWPTNSPICAQELLALDAARDVSCWRWSDLSRARGAWPLGLRGTQPQPPAADATGPGERLMASVWIIRRTMKEARHDIASSFVSAAARRRLSRAARSSRAERPTSAATSVETPASSAIVATPRRNRLGDEAA